MNKKMMDSILEVTQDDFLRVLYEHRNNSGGIFTQVFKEKMKKINQKKQQAYSELIDKLKEKIKDNSDVEEIIIALENYIEKNNDESGYYMEEYYSTGVKDGVKMMLQCFK